MQGSPGEVASWFGAIQAQDYLAALWALGMRTTGATEQSIEAAIADGSVLRTHIFRGTWQYVSRDDVGWMLDLVGERILRGSASRFRDLELDERTLRRCGELFARALEEGAHLTREEMADVLERGRLKGMRGRLMHILGHAELSKVIVSGGRRGKQPTFALFTHRAPKPRTLGREEALAELALRYFQSRGPATVRDFSWWTGLPMRDARVAIELAGKALQPTEVGGRSLWLTSEKPVRPRTGTVHLLPAFDEYLVGYSDRCDVLDPRFTRRVNAGGGLLKPAIVIDGQVVGTWQRTIGQGGVTVKVSPFTKLKPDQAERVMGTAEKYAKFLGLHLR